MRGRAVRRSLLAFGTLLCAGLCASACSSAPSASPPRTIARVSLTSWHRPTTIRQPIVEAGGFETTRSCVLGPACTEIGWNHRGDTGYLWTARWQHRGWTELPAPPHAVGIGATDQLTLSCATASWCMATGSAALNNYGVNAPTAAVLHDATWTEYPVPSPKGSTDFWLSHVDCLSTTWCMATGEYVASEPHYVDAQFLASEVWNGATWRVVRIFSPRTDAHQIDPGFDAGGEHPTANLDQLACVSTSFCVVAGSWVGGFIEQWNGTQWTETPAPGAGLHREGGAEFSGAACTSEQFCVATGGYPIANGIWSPLVDEWNGSRWTTVPLPANPHGINHEGGFSMTGVTCGSASDCLSLGDVGTSWRGLAMFWNGATWHYVRAGTIENGAVVCVTPRRCT